MVVYVDLIRYNNLRSWYYGKLDDYYRPQFKNSKEVKLLKSLTSLLYFNKDLSDSDVIKTISILEDENYLCNSETIKCCNIGKISISSDEIRVKHTEGERIV